MAYPDYVRERARQLRVEKKLSLDEIAERLALPKTTVYYWISDLPLGRPRSSEAQRRRNQAMQAKYARLRDDAYVEGFAQYDELVGVPTFREFVALYIAEGLKRNRNRVQIANSDERIIAMASGWLHRLTTKAQTFSIQYHADQDLEELRTYWAGLLCIDPSEIKLQRKSNSNQLTGRTWRSAHGVMSITVDDMYLRARLQAWIDRIRGDWGLDCGAIPGV
jgi:transcriptional regulator with XRE-family HTH domain